MPILGAMRSVREMSTSMILLYVHVIQSSNWLSALIPHAFLLFSRRDLHDEHLPTFAHDDDVLSALGSGTTTCEDTDAEEPPLEDAPASEMAFEAGDPETDNVLAQ